MEGSIAGNAICLLSDSSAADGAAMTFDRVQRRMARASDSILIHMFVWRNDRIGNLLGREVIAAADRGVKIHIYKDVGAFLYERVEMNRKSFFNIPISRAKRLMHRISAWTFPDTYVQDSHTDDLGRQVLGHDNVTIEWVDHTHTKYYLFDQQFLITGSINIEDRHRGYRDYMVEITGKASIDRFNRRRRGQVPFDLDRTLEFVFNHVVDGEKRFEIKPIMLDLISRVRRSLYIEMAYIGDPDLSRGIIDASKRGVAVTILFSEAANIGNDINYRSLFRICRAADIAVYLSKQMIHSKMMMFDDERVVLGSANTSIFSMQKAEEMDIVVKDHPEFLHAVKETLGSRMSQARRVESLTELSGYRRVTASLQQLHQLIH